MKLNHKLTIEKNYGFIIQDCKIGPRQCVAETYILSDERRNQYFCKLTDKALFIPEIIKSLPAVYEMHTKGIERISYPTKTINGELYVMDGDVLIVLYNYIPAKQSYKYSAYVFGRLLSEIEAVTSRLTVEIPKENFNFTFKSRFEEYFEGTLTTQSKDKIVCQLKSVLQKYESEIRGYLSEYLRLSEVCKREKIRMVITHGDAPGNVLVKSYEDIYLIDWDEILLAPPERDIWIMDQHQNFLDGYRSINKSYQANNNMRSYYIYKYYFRSLVQYLAEILRDFPAKHRTKYLKDMESGLLRGWMMPKLKEINTLNITA